MSPYESGKIRNVVFLSHYGAGKTSLVEAMLSASGAISRLGSVEQGTTASDYDPSEIERKMSINLSLLPLEWKGIKLNIIDTPGYADFASEVKAGLRVSDAAIIVICATSGVEVGTEQMWDYSEQNCLPRLIFVNKMDRENADFSRTLSEIQAKLGAKCLPVQLPLGSQEDFQGVMDLVPLQDNDLPSPLQDQVISYREKLIEVVVETNDELLTKYLEGEEISNEEISGAIREATITGKLVPVLIGSALRSLGITPVLDAIRDYLPSPEDRGAIMATNPATGATEELEPSVDSPLSSLVFKTTVDPYVGKLSYFRVCSGLIGSNSQVWNANKGGMERIGQLLALRGKNQEPVPQVVAGDIGVVDRLNLTTT